MSNQLGQSAEAELPYVPEAIVNRLLDVDTMQPGFVAEEWHNLSRANPYLRDLITIISVTEEPHNLEGRQKIINYCVLIVAALRCSAETHRLDDQILQTTPVDRLGLIIELSNNLAALPEQSLPTIELPRVEEGFFGKLNTAFCGLLRFRRQPTGDGGV
jgi:hypothetical protein